MFMGTETYKQQIKAKGRCLNHPSETQPCATCRKWRQQRAARLREAGRCGCGRPVKSGRRACESCLHRAIESQKKVQLRKKESGVCITGGCYSIAASGHTLCDVHLTRMRAAANERRHDRKTNGLCVQCGARSEFGQARCLTCSAPFRRGLPNPVRAALTRSRKQEAQKARDTNCLKAREFIDRNLYLVRDERARLILQMRYGYTEATCKTLEEVGEELRVTRERVRQIQQAAEETISMYTIEKDVPLPESGRGQFALLTETLKTMEVGDSFLMPLKSRTSPLTAAAKSLGVIVTTRKASDTERRVWLVSKNGHAGTEPK